MPSLGAQTGCFTHAYNLSAPNALCQKRIQADTALLND